MPHNADDETGFVLDGRPVRKKWGGKDIAANEIHTLDRFSLFFVHRDIFKSQELNNGVNAIHCHFQLWKMGVNVETSISHSEDGV